MSNDKNDTKKGIWNKIKSWFSKLYNSLVKQNATPKSIAWGASVGVFIGVFPTFGLGIPVAVGLAYIFRFNRASAIIGSTVMNPVTTPFFWALSAFLGGLIKGFSFSEMVERWNSGQLFSLGKEMTLVYLIGNTIVSLVLSVIIWFLIYYGAKRARSMKRRSP